MSNFRDGYESWFSNLRKVRLMKEAFYVNEVLDGRHIQQHFGTDDAALVSTQYTQIFTATDRYNGKLLLGMTEATGRAKEINSERFRWTLSGGNTEYPRVSKIVCTDAKPGLHNSTFDIVVDKPYFSVSDIIQPEDWRVRCLVVVPDGYSTRSLRPEATGGYRYTLRLITDDPNEFVNPRYIQVGHEWSQVSSAVPTERNMDGGGFNFYAVFESMGQTQQHAKKYALTDRACRKIKQAKERGARTCDVNGDGVSAKDYAAITTALWVERKDGKGVTHTYDWMSAFDMELMNRLHQDVENTLMFGRQSSNNYSAEGYQILTASGLREQIETGHVLPHNGTLDIATLENWFDSIMKHRIAEQNRNIVLACGYEFRKLFDRMIKEEARTFTTIDTLFIRKGEDFRNLHFGSYFSSYKGFTVDISVTENAAYDNRDFSRRTLPGRPDTPIDSMRADILDFASTSEQGTGLTTDNICMIYESYLNYNIRHSGKWDAKSLMPITDGGIGNTGAIADLSFHVEKNAALMVADPSRCGSIFFAG